MLLLNQVREQRHEASALDRVRELALMPGADAGALTRHNLPEGRKVALKRLRILVIDRTDIDLAKVTRLGFT